MPNISVSETLFVAAAPERVFDFTQDYGRRAEWDSAILGAEVLHEAPQRTVRIRGPAGLRALLVYKLFDRPRMTSLEMRDIERGFGVTGGGGSWRYEPAEGGTLWTQNNTLVVRSRGLHWLLAPGMRWHLRRITRKAMARAKALIEGAG
jgi:hypothetical protein